MSTPGVRASMPMPASKQNRMFVSRTAAVNRHAVQSGGVQHCLGRTQRHAVEGTADQKHGRSLYRQHQYADHSPQDGITNRYLA